MKKCLAALLALGLVFSGLPLIGDGIGLETTVSAASVIPSPTGIKKKATDSTVTISWDQADGAAFYNIFLYYEDSDEYEFLMSVSKTNITFSAMPMRDYSFKLSTVVIGSEGMQESRLTKAFTVRTKGHSKMKFPDTKKAGLPGLSLSTATAAAEMLPGAFGSEFEYESEAELEEILAKIENYRKKYEKSGYVFTVPEETEESEEQEDTVYDAIITYEGVNIATFSIFVNEGHAVMMITPFDYTRWGPPIV